jgi:dihydroorotate dehydrogenase subfamily 1
MNKPRNNLHPTWSPQSWPAKLGIKSPFTIPSGIVTTVPSVIARIAREVPEIGFITTKTLSVAPRAGYREPVLHEYYPGCFINAVGLANPGAARFVETMKPFLPLWDSKPLVVSVMGSDPEEFLECALILDPIADAFELNLSCPHVKGAGQSVGSDPAAVRAVIKLFKTRLNKPVIPKLSPNLGDIPGMARLCEEAGADGLALINTVGPGTATDFDGFPVLSNVAGGLSGAGILPVGIKAVREAASAVKLPIIASGGVSSAADVRSYRRAGATLFAVGSALAGMTTPQVADFFRTVAQSGASGPDEETPVPCACSATRTSYSRTLVKENRPIGPDLFSLRLEKGPACDPGRFFFLRLPGVGEKPFSPAADEKPQYLVRSVGPFTRALADLKPGDSIYMRGPYGKGFPEPKNGTPFVLVGGGTGIAPLIMAATRWPNAVSGAFFGFSAGISDSFRTDVTSMVPEARIVVDTPGRVGDVVRALAADLSDRPMVYKDAALFVCGPGPMMKAVAESLDGKVPRDRIFVAREDVMRCGIGLCGSCGTETGLRSCTDGPVIRGEEG